MKSKVKGLRVCPLFVMTVVAILLMQCALSHQSWAADEMTDIYARWENGEYQDVVPSLIEYMQKPYGKNPVTFYLLASSLCRIPEFKKESRKYFMLLLNRFSLDASSREQVEKEMKECAPAAEKKPMKIVFITQRIGGGTAGVRGKMYYWLDSEYAPLVSDPAEMVREIPLDELRKRLFPKAEKDVSLQELKQRVGVGYVFKSSAHFIGASFGQHGGEQLNTILAGLETYLRFYVTEYSMPEPQDLITVYLVADTWKLRELADKIHGLKVSDSSIGYSYQADLSIVGVIPTGRYGTLSHELFHLMVHNNFGDIPPWMEEGMASLYEVSKIEDGKIIGLPNWRGKVLKRFWSLRPSVGSLLKMDWRSFDNAEHDYAAKKQAANHAMARYFILYLQDKGRLKDVYSAFRDRRIEEMSEDPGQDSVQLIEKVMQKDVGSIDADFVKWFER